MAKVTLGKRPSSFKGIVKFPAFGGSEAEVEMSFRYRTRTEFAALIDANSTETRERLDALSPAEGAHLGDEALTGVLVRADANYILQIADGWDLTDPFDAVHVQQLVDEHPASARAIADAYTKLIREGRLGN